MTYSSRNTCAICHFVVYLSRTQQTLDQRNSLIDDMRKELDHHQHQEDTIQELVLVLNVIALLGSIIFCTLL